MSLNPEEKNLEDTADITPQLAEQPVEIQMSTGSEASSELAEASKAAAQQFPLVDKTDEKKPPQTLEQKKKVWTRRIIGAIVLFAVLGSLALLAAAQAVTFLFKTILTP